MTGDERNRLWKELLTHKSIKKGWYLARPDVQAAFVEDLLWLEMYASNINEHLVETRRQLKIGAYRPHNLLEIDIPKSELSVRPGSVIALQDLIVWLAIVRQLAPVFDRKLPPSVYSYRVKEGFGSSRARASLFRETDIYDLPFIKKKSMSSLEVDPFEPWYALWPRFDEESRRVFEDEGDS